MAKRLPISAALSALALTTVSTTVFWFLNDGSSHSICFASERALFPCTHEALEGLLSSEKNFNVSSACKLAVLALLPFGDGLDNTLD